MYGIPNMKLEKWVIERKVDVMKKEGITFVTGADVGRNYRAGKIRKEFDRIILACGASNPRDIDVPGRGQCRHILCGGFSESHHKEPAGFRTGGRKFYIGKG